MEDSFEMEREKEAARRSYWWAKIVIIGIWKKVSDMQGALRMLESRYKE